MFCCVFSVSLCLCFVKMSGITPSNVWWISFAELFSNPHWTSLVSVCVDLLFVSYRRLSFCSMKWRTSALLVLRPLFTLNLVQDIWWPIFWTPFAWNYHNLCLCFPQFWLIDFLNNSPPRLITQCWRFPFVPPFCGRGKMLYYSFNSHFPFPPIPPSFGLALIIIASVIVLS